MAPPSHVKAAAPKVKGSFTMRAVNQAPIASGSTARGSAAAGKKRKQPVQELPSDDDEDDDMDGGVADIEEDDASDAEEDVDTDDEIAAAQQAGKSKKTAKRKRRATSPTTFGEALSGLLGGDIESRRGEEEDDDEEAPQGKTAATSARAPGQPTILSLAPHIRRSAQSSRLNAKAARIALEARRKREDRAHVVDVIGGWGAPGEAPKTLAGEAKGAVDTRDDAEKIGDWLSQGGAQGYEKRLRKAAQRGVVKLFNAIRAAQNTTQEDLEEQKVALAKSKVQAAPVTDAQGPANVSLKKGENALGGKARAVNELSKSNFFDLIRAGTSGQRA